MPCNGAQSRHHNSLAGPNCLCDMCTRLLMCPFTLATHDTGSSPLTHQPYYHAPSRTSSPSPQANTQKCNPPLSGNNTVKLCRRRGKRALPTSGSRSRLAQVEPLRILLGRGSPLNGSVPSYLPEQIMIFEVRDELLACVRVHRQQCARARLSIHTKLCVGDSPLDRWRSRASRLPATMDARKPMAV